MVLAVALMNTPAPDFAWVLPVLHIDPSNCGLRPPYITNEGCAVRITPLLECWRHMRSTRGRYEPATGWKATYCLLQNGCFHSLYRRRAQLSERHNVGTFTATQAEKYTWEGAAWSHQESISCTFRLSTSAFGLSFPPFSLRYGEIPQPPGNSSGL